MKLCPKCKNLLYENSYFNKWECRNNSCDYTEIIKNNQWIEKLTEMSIIVSNGGYEKIPSDKNIIDKINEIIDIVNKITNPRV